MSVPFRLNKRTFSANLQMCKKKKEITDLTLREMKRVRDWCDNVARLCYECVVSLTMCLFDRKAPLKCRFLLRLSVCCFDEMRNEWFIFFSPLFVLFVRFCLFLCLLLCLQYFAPMIQVPAWNLYRRPLRSGVDNVQNRSWKLILVPCVVRLNAWSNCHGLAWARIL